MPYSGMWRHVDLMWANVSNERIASIFRVEKSAREKPAWAGDCVRVVKDIKNTDVTHVTRIAHFDEILLHTIVQFFYTVSISL
jgi:hypothetical protein